MTKKLILILFVLLLAGCSGQEFGAGVKRPVWDTPAGEYLKLKAGKEKIINYAEERVCLEIEKKSLECNKYGDIVTYQFITDKKITTQTIVKNGKKWKEVKRTINTVVFLEDKEDKLGATNIEKMTRIYVGTPFYQDEETGEWYEVAVATTTSEAYYEQTATSTEMLGASGDPIYANSDSRGLYNNGSATWDDTHDATSGTFYPNNGLCSYNYLVTAPHRWQINRCVMFFDTSSLDGETITSASLIASVKNKWENASDSATYGFTSVVDASSVGTTLATSDFDIIGDAVDNPTEGHATSERQFTSDYAVNADVTWDLNSTGISWINKTGTTALGLRNGNDILDSEPTGINSSVPDGLLFYGYDDATYKPYLEVYYGGATPATTATPEILFFN